MVTNRSRSALNRSMTSLPRYSPATRPARLGIPVFEYGAKTVKMAVVGTGGADKEQVGLMVRRLLPGAAQKRADAADALAVAICHAHHRATKNAWKAPA